MTKRAGLYLHIPFCEQKCAYCNFITFIRQDDKMERYVDYLTQEMKMYHQDDLLIDTVYLGGGTPSYLPDALVQKLMAAVEEHFNLSEQAEITIEMNPESVNARSLDVYLGAGINRFSMGVQTFNDEVLKIMGRLHSREVIFEKLKLIEKAGIDNLSIDLMFANPKQTLEVWKEDLALALSAPIQHFSAYSLMLKENTAYEKWLEAGLIEMADDETDREMYHYLQDEAKQAGFDQYEISSFAKPGYQSRHNRKYWIQEDYFGLGIGGSSAWQDKRYTNVSTFDRYFSLIDEGKYPIDELETYDPDDLEREYIMTKMRLLEGIDLDELDSRFHINFLEKYQYAVDKHLKTGIIQLQGRQLSFTRFGLDVGNQFYLDLID